MVLLVARVNHLSQRLLAAAHSLCQRMDAGLDILVPADGIELPVTMTDFVQALHQSGVNCTLTRIPELRPREIVRYANSHECITTVVIDSRENWNVASSGKSASPWRKLVCPLVMIEPNQD
ncbi:MAG: hypothetical protein QMD17_04865 [Rhodocyclaceae bacterium]|jgi:hypothetical protein|nr:hypothetical protein [Rhodocyclaceae bacterium]